MYLENNFGDLDNEESGKRTFSHFFKILWSHVKFQRVTRMSLPIFLIEVHCKGGLLLIILQTTSIVFVLYRCSLSKTSYINWKFAKYCTPIKTTRNHIPVSVDLINHNDYIVACRQLQEGT